MQLFEGEEPEFDELSLNFTIDELREALIGGYGEEATKLQWGTPDAEMVRHLYRNVYQFSVAKNFAQMRTLTSALIDENGHTRSFSDFMNEAAKIDKKFNVDYLRAEYDTAVNSAEMASHWVRFKQMGDPMLRYVTVGDERVRASHAAMNGLQRPMSDPIWDKIYPPNGWNCRCTVVTTTGAATPGKQIRMPWDVPPMFQTNLAKTGMLWPKDHPYFKALPGPTAKHMVELSDDKYIEHIAEQGAKIGKEANYTGKAVKQIVKQEIGLDATFRLPKKNNGSAGLLKVTNFSIKQSILAGAHNGTKLGKLAVLEAYRNPQNLYFIGSSALDAKENTDNKIARGVIKYHYYGFDWADYQWVINCEEIETKGDKFEQIYSIQWNKETSR